MSITKRPIVDTEREEVGRDLLIEQRGPEPKELLEDPRMETRVEIASKDQLKTSKMELEKFMNEEVEILIQEPMDISMGETWVVALTVGRITQRVMRGVSQRIKRKYIEVLARARKAGVSAQGYKAPDGEAVNSFRRTSRALEYPFQVLHDPSGKRGIDWLTKILRNER